ncbi:MAG TPA: hypothetical protein VF042_14125 [Gemmatimonadaceae bacterium]
MISGTEWLVVLAGLAVIGWVNWYFFIAGRSPGQANAGATGTESTQEQTTTIDGAQRRSSREG